MAILKTSKKRIAAEAAAVERDADGLCVVCEGGGCDACKPRNPVVERWNRKAALPAAYNRAPKMEAATVKRLHGGRAIPASGAKFRKADVEVVNLCRVECKATGAKSFSVTQEMIDKVENAGLLNGQIPYIEIEFVDRMQKVTGSACVLTRHALTSLMNRLANAEGIGTTDRRGSGPIERRKYRLAKKHE